MYNICEGALFVCNIEKLMLIREFWILSGTLNKFWDPNVPFKSLEESG